MSKPYDATPKFLIDFQPSAWSKLMGYSSDKVKICNVDLSTITTSVDTLLLVGGKRSEGLHLEFQSRYDRVIGERILVYNVLASRAQQVSIHSVLFLLRKEADGPAVNGRVDKIRVDGTPYLEFHYDVVRVWELSSEALLKGELGTLPLAFIADATPEQIPSLVRRAAKRLARETSRSKEGEMWTAVSVLMGMKFEEEFVAHTLKGIHTMTDSVTYQAILRQGKEMGVREGAAHEARTMVLRFGINRFGEPDKKTLAALNRINSVEQLESLADRFYKVSSWKELLTK